MPILVMKTAEADTPSPSSPFSGETSMRLMTPLILAMTVVNSGCIAHSLQRQTLATSNSAMDLRYREVTDNLAIIAHEPATLPSYSSIFSGTVQITDSAGVGS